MGQAAAVPALAVLQGQAAGRALASTQVGQLGGQGGIATVALAVDTTGIEQGREPRRKTRRIGTGAPGRGTNAAGRSQADPGHHRPAGLAGIQGIGDIEQLQIGIHRAAGKALGTAAQQRRRGTRREPTQDLASCPVAHPMSALRAREGGILGGEKLQIHDKREGYKLLQLGWG